MKCPNCGREIGDEKLLCEYCGEEVKFVPLFDTEIENQIDETISNIVKNFNSEPQKQKQEEDPLEDKNSLDREKVGQSVAIIILGVIILLFVILFAAYKIYQHNTLSSFDYQYEKAISYENEGDYENAIKYMEHALAIDSSNLNARYELGILYIKYGQYHSGIVALEELLDISDGDNKDIYISLLQALLEEKNYTGLAEIINSCPYDDLVQEYIEFSTFDPEFSYDEGVYDEKIDLEIFDKNTDGIIYYTLDGSKPTTNSEVFDSSIPLESGDYTIKAIFVNMYGLSSDVVTKTFYISLAKPAKPEVSLDTGIYTEPTLIEVYHDKSTKIYYTLDGSLPDENSNRYTEPFEMPFGTSNIAFIAIDENGLTSDVVRRTYQLNVTTNISKEIVVQLLINNLVVKGYLTDVDGHSENKDGYYSYSISTIINKDGYNYYIIDEYYNDLIEGKQKTNNSYAIAANDGEAYKAIKTGEGKYNLKSL